MTSVSYCHRQNVIHRDLKLENVLLDHPWNSKESEMSPMIKISDFASAVFNNPKKKMTEVYGSPYYIAPEVLLG